MVERAVVREDKRTMAEARTTMDSSSRVEAMAEARMTMVVNVVRNTTDRKDSKVDMVVVRMTMVVNVVRNITDRKDSRVDMVEDRIVMAEDSKTTALKVDAQEEETFLRAESKFFTQR
jgi:L-aminopeptidase/D-esterase-like protein